MVLLIFLGGLGVSMLIGLPVAFSLLVTGVLMMLWMDVFDPQILADTMYNGADSFPLMAIPFFLLAGELMSVGGMSKRIVTLITSLLGHVRGGLGYAAVIASVLMASLSGSAVADAAAIGVLLIPMMREAGYDVPRATGLIAAGGVIAPIIPPSIAFIIFGVAANVSIIDLFLAGVTPGILMGLWLIIIWSFLARRESVSVTEWPGWGVVGRSVMAGIWALLMPVIIVGGLKFGVFTPTEASVVAIAYALFVGGVVYRELSVAKILEACKDAAIMSASVMFLVAAAALTGWLVTVAQLPFLLVDVLEQLIETPRLLMLVIVVLVLVIGMVMDFVPTVLILTPVLMPLIKIAGIDPVYFGVVFVMSTAVGLLTPPVGVVLNVACGIGGVSMEQGSRGVAPFVLMQVTLLLLLVAAPQLVLTPLNWLR
ncbi:MAG: TRAP transporter large permease subunit [Alphaproteobacteria bacterium]|nr:TRAP transporter large permease subunit [Alphaproteobacteria bacterium]MCY4496148.1 TRAP transporter large permease subunit [Rhodospirillaceae bacterium]